MNLKRLLYYDFSRVFRGKDHAPAEDHQDAFDGFELDKEDFAPGRNYQVLGQCWRGPVYYTARNHRRDLQYIIDQTRGIVRTNAPMARGLNALAREERRRDRGPGRVYALKKAAAITAAFILFVFITARIFDAVGISFFATVPVSVTITFLAVAVGAFSAGKKKATLIYIFVALLSAASFYFFLSFGDSHVVRSTIRAVFYTNDPELVAVFTLIVLTAVCFVLAYSAARKGGPRELVLLRLRDLLEGGCQLSEAMRRLPRFFPRFHADMVEAGEQTGRMDACLTELSADLEAGMSQHRTLRGAFLYLGIVAAIQTAIACFIMIRVTPVFYEISHEFGSKVNMPFLAFLARYVTGFRNMYVGGFILIGATGLAVILLLMRNFRKRRRGLSSRPVASLLLFIPGLRGLIMQNNFTVIACTLEKLLRAGIPLDAALEKASAGDLTPAYARMLRRVHARILEGDSFTAAFQTASTGLLVPASFTSLTAVGEQADMLPEALAYLHSFYRTQASVRARILVDVVKPLGVMVLGLATLLLMSDLFGMMAGLTDTLLNSM